MIDAALLFLKGQLNAHLALPVIGQAPMAAEDAVVFPDGDKLDPLTFRMGAVTMLMIGMEQEKVLRPADQYVKVNSEGTPYRAHPDIRLELNILFIARYKEYERSLAQLSRIISFFQQRPSFDPQSAPELPPALAGLSVELVTLPFAKQHELWNALKIPVQPAVQYMVRMITFTDAGLSFLTPVSGATAETRHADPAGS